LDIKTDIIALPIVLLIFFTNVACTTTSSRPKRLTEGSANGFSVGEIYKVTESMEAVTWGTRTYLVAKPSSRNSGRKPTAVVQVTAGTLVRISAICRENTLTRGIECWAEGVIDTGVSQKMRVSLANEQLKASLRKLER
jgi:hypothetical protein